jgi:putative ABC transport system permease protein
LVKVPSYPRYALKSIRAKKFRFVLGVLAIAVAIGVFGVTNVIIDATSTSYLPNIAEATGQVDIRIINYNITSTPPIEDYESLIPIVNNTEGVAGATPRYTLQGAKFQGVSKNFTVNFLGIDPIRESNIGFGNLILAPDTLLSNLPVNHCWVREEIAEALELEIGSEYTIKVGIFDLNLTLDATYVNDGMLPSDEENVVVVNIETLEPYTEGPGYATEVVAQFANRDELYDINRPEQTIENAKEIGIAIQDAIGTDYQVYLPITYALETRETGLVFIRILFNALSFLGIFVSGFLIFSLMTVSVEDKTREFALYRTIGAKRHQIFLLVLTEAGVISVAGSIIGVGLSYLFALIVKRFLLRQEITIPIKLAPLVILYSVLLGLGVALVASLFPAMRAVRKSIISGLNPLKAEEPDLKLVRERGPNKTLFIIGLAIALSTGLIFILIPVMTVTATDTVFFVVLLSLFFGFGLGLTLITVGVFEPIVENFFLLTIKPTFKKISKIVRMFLKRNRRRNAITAMMFVLAFGSTMIISVTFIVQDQGTIKNFGSISGSDISIFDIDYDLNGSALLDEISAEFPEVISTSYRTLPVSAALAGMWTIAGDQILFKNFGVNVIGVPPNIAEPLYADQIIYTEGSEAMFTVVQQNQTVIINEALSKELNLGVGDSLRLQLLTLNPVLIELGYTKDIFLEIVGVVGKFPGFPGIHQQERFASGSTILIGEETWTFLTELDFQDSAYRLFLDIDNERNTQTIGDEIRRRYESDSLGILITPEIIDRIIESNQTRVTLVNIMLVFTIIIAVFGVFASTYSNVSESHKTIGILKAIGLRNSDVDRIFILESTILTLSSSILGAILGYSLGYYLYIINAIELEWKIPVVAPPTLALLSLAIAVVIAGIGAFIATRSISRKTASELIRVE